MTNDENTGGDNARTRSTTSIVFAAVAIGLCVLLELVVVTTRHRFDRMFNDFGVDRSVVSRFAVGPSLAILLAIIIVTAVAKEFVPSLRHIANSWNVTVLLITPVLLALYVVGIFSPLMRLISSLSG